MSTVPNLSASSTCAVRIRRAGLAGSLAVLALLGACAAPATTVTRDYSAPDSAPAAYTEYGTVLHVDVVEPRQPVEGGAGEVSYVVTVKLDDGSRRQFDRTVFDGMEVGQRVRVRGDVVTAVPGM